jgi:hypothetical protein
MQGFCQVKRISGSTSSATKGQPGSVASKDRKHENDCPGLQGCQPRLSIETANLIPAQLMHLESSYTPPSSYSTELLRLSHGRELLFDVRHISARVKMASASDDYLVQSPTSDERRVGLLPSHANTLSTDVELPSKSDKPPLLKHMYIFKLLLILWSYLDTNQLNT